MQEAILFLLKTIGLGIITGFVFGYLFKKVSKIILFLAAVIVVLVFVLGHNEILDIDWLKLIDKGRDFFEQYFYNYQDRFRLLLRNLPFTIGLIIGLIIGLKKG